MEFKVKFIIRFLRNLKMNSNQLVNGKWASQRESLWFMLTSTGLLENGLLKQLNRLPGTSERMRRLMNYINR